MHRGIVFAALAAGAVVWLSRRQPAVAAADNTPGGFIRHDIAPASLFAAAAPVQTVPAPSDWDRLTSIDESTLNRGTVEWLARAESGQFQAPQSVQI